VNSYGDGLLAIFPPSAIRRALGKSACVPLAEARQAMDDGALNGKETARRVVRHE